MSDQSYANHTHHPVFTYVASGFWLLAFTGYTAGRAGYRWGPAFTTLGLLGAMLCLISITRAYTTRLQDRIIMLEERLRASMLLTPAQLARWGDLTPKQVAALRFASDAEFATLFEQAVSDNMRPDAIKRAVKQWRADLRRT